MPVDEKVASIFTSFSGIKERIKAKIPEQYVEAAERMRINPRGPGAPGEHHEMGTFRTFERSDGTLGGPGDYCEGHYQEGFQNNSNIGGGDGSGNPFLFNPNENSGEIDPHTGTSGKISAWQAGWNVTNAIQGMFIVALPYAVLHGGYWGVFSLAFIAYICCHTGKILVECLYEPNEKGEIVRVRDSYVKIAEDCLGEDYGGKMVNTAQIIELLMTCILYVVLCGDLLIGSFPDGMIDQRSWMMLCTMMLLPCAFLTDLQAVSTLSFWCTVTHIIINFIIFGYCFTQIGDWQWSKVTFGLDGSTFPITLGIVVFSYTSQIFLPTLEGNMENPKEFQPMLDWSHIAAGLGKALFAYVGFLTFGDQTQDVITNNLPTRSFRAFVNLTLVVKALLSYPLPYYAACQLLEQAWFRPKPKPESRIDGDGPQPFPTCWGRDNDMRVWALALRVLLILFTMFMAISIPHFAILMGLIGSFTGTMLSFVWPCYFHMKLKWHEMTTRQIAWEVSIIVMGVLCGVIGIITSFAALVEAYHLPLPNPAGWQQAMETYYK